MIDGLSESTRALLDAARQGLAPDAAAVKRVHAKVAAGGLFAGLGMKLLILALVGGAATAVVLARHGAAADAPIVAVHEAAVVEVSHAGAATARVEAPPPAQPAAPILVVVEHHADLAREVALIDAASHGEPRAALAVLQIYEAETAGHGQLAEDAAAIAIEAHCKLHEPVDAKLAAFDARWPSSAQRARLAETCK